jgi:hypothetical protein
VAKNQNLRSSRSRLVSLRRCVVGQAITRTARR